MANTRNIKLKAILNILNDRRRIERNSNLFCEGKVEFHNTNLPVDLYLEKYDNNRNVYYLHSEEVKYLVDLYNWIAKHEEDVVININWYTTGPFTTNYNRKKANDWLPKFLVENNLANDFLTEFAKTKEIILALDDTDVRKASALSVMDELAATYDQDWCLNYSKSNNNMLQDALLKTKALVSADITTINDPANNVLKDFTASTKQVYRSGVNRSLAAALFTLGCVALFAAAIALAIVLPPLGLGMAFTGIALAVTILSAGTGASISLAFSGIFGAAHKTNMLARRMDDLEQLVKPKI